MIKDFILNTLHELNVSVQTGATIKVLLLFQAYISQRMISQAGDVRTGLPLPTTLKSTSASQSIAPVRATLRPLQLRAWSLQTSLLLQPRKYKNWCQPSIQVSVACSRPQCSFDSHQQTINAYVRRRRNPSTIVRMSCMYGTDILLWNLSTQLL